MGWFDGVKQSAGDAKKMYDLARQAKKIQKELRDILIEASSLDDKVRVVFNGEQKIEEVHIHDDLLSPEQGRNLEKGLKDAVTQALKKAQQIAMEKAKDITGGLGLPGL